MLEPHMENSQTDKGNKKRFLLKKKSTKSAVFTDSLGLTSSLPLCTSKGTAQNFTPALYYTLPKFAVQTKRINLCLQEFLGYPVKTAGKLLLELVSIRPLRQLA